MSSKTRSKIFCRVWYIIYHEKKRTVCAFLVLFYHLLGMILQPCKETEKGSRERRKNVLGSLLLTPYGLYVLFEYIKSKVK